MKIVIIGYREDATPTGVTALARLAACMVDHGTATDAVVDEMRRGFDRISRFLDREIMRVRRPVERKLAEPSERRRYSPPVNTGKLLPSVRPVNKRSRVRPVLHYRRRGF